uniref:ABC-2 type transporter transmembrane domain-containing protein n=1 Tax=Panagrolaimus sp. JU765 TaxID=591449 RepID=A0AC34R837_9BILA
MPIFIIDGMLMLTISYWMIGLAPYFHRYLINIGIGILIEQCAASAGVMLSTSVSSYSIAISIAGPALTVLSLTGGLFVNVGELPGFISWTQYFSWFKYGFEALMINQWTGIQKHFIGPKHLTPSQIMNQYSFKLSNFWIDIGAMIGFILIFYLIGYIGLYIRVRRNR